MKEQVEGQAGREDKRRRVIDCVIGEEGRIVGISC